MATQVFGGFPAECHGGVELPAVGQSKTASIPYRPMPKKRTLRESMKEEPQENNSELSGVRAAAANSSSSTELLAQQPLGTQLRLDPRACAEPDPVSWMQASAEESVSSRAGVGPSAQSQGLHHEEGTAAPTMSMTVPRAATYYHSIAKEMKLQMTQPQGSALHGGNPGAYQSHSPVIPEAALQAAPQSSSLTLSGMLRTPDGLVPLRRCGNDRLALPQQQQQQQQQQHQDGLAEPAVPPPSMPSASPALSGMAQTAGGSLPSYSHPVGAGERVASQSYYDGHCDVAYMMTQLPPQSTSAASSAPTRMGDGLTTSPANGVGQPEVPRHQLEALPPADQLAILLGLPQQSQASHPPQQYTQQPGLQHAAAGPSAPCQASASGQAAAPNIREEERVAAVAAEPAMPPPPWRSKPTGGASTPSTSSRLPRPADAAQDHDDRAPQRSEPPRPELPRPEPEGLERQLDDRLSGRSEQLRLDRNDRSRTRPEEPEPDHSDTARRRHEHLNYNHQDRDPRRPEEPERDRHDKLPRRSEQSQQEMVDRARRRQDESEECRYPRREEHLQQDCSDRARQRHDEAEQDYHPRRSETSQVLDGYDGARRRDDEPEQDRHDRRRYDEARQDLHDRSQRRPNEQQPRENGSYSADRSQRRPEEPWHQGSGDRLRQDERQDCHERARQQPDGQPRDRHDRASDRPPPPPPPTTALALSAAHGLSPQSSSGRTGKPVEPQDRHGRALEPWRQHGSPKGAGRRKPRVEKPWRGAGIISFRSSARQLDVCLVAKRNGQLGFPKGGAEEVDASALENAMREWCEETNLSRDHLRFLPLPGLSTEAHKVDWWGVHYFYAEWIAPSSVPSLLLEESWAVKDDKDDPDPIIMAYWMNVEKAQTHHALSKPRKDMLWEALNFYRSCRNVATAPGSGGR